MITDAAVKQHLLDPYDKVELSAQKQGRVAPAQEPIRRGAVDRPLFGGRRRGDPPVRR
ncbi:MAG TPA: hypothetical protein VGD48_18865 [Kutzneria sp.]|jgi:hypothetical protein